MSDVPDVSALTVPASPTVTATPNNDGTVSLSWTSPQSATAFTVQRYDGTSWSDVVTDSATTLAVDSGLSGDTTYQYRALAINDTGAGAFGDSAAALTVPDAPDNLAASAVSSTEIDLAWTGDTNNDVTYTIYGAVGSGSSDFQIVDTTAGVTSYENTGLTAGTIYSYKVVATNDTGDNATPALSSETITFPDGPTALSKSVVSGTVVDLAWTDSPSANRLHGFARPRWRKLYAADGNSARQHRRQL